MNKQRCRNDGEKGFTLVEVLLYIGIFSLIIGGIVGLGVTATAKRIQSQALADLNYQGEAIMSLMIQTIRQAESVNGPLPGNNSDTLSLEMSDTGVDPTIYRTVSRSSYNALVEQEGGGAEGDLTNSRVSISNLRFTNMSVGNTAGSIRIQFDVTYNNPTERKEFDVTRSFSSGATIP